MKYLYWIFFHTCICTIIPVVAQISSFPYTESFDSVAAPALPAGWSANGFIINTSVSRSSPNCISATGNMATKSIISPVLDFTGRVPDKLIFWERRSSTAVTYRLELRASIDEIHYDILLAQFDTTTSTSSYIQRSVDLSSAALQEQPSVRLLWQMCGDNMNNTGVLRVDDISLTVRTGYDIGFSRMIITPDSANREDPLTFSTVVINHGSLAIIGFSVRYYYDENFNNRAEPGEQFSIITGLSLNSGDSLICSVFHPPMKAGEHVFLAAIDFVQDENGANDTIYSAVNIGYVKGDILLNEIMYAPTGDEPEWVEIYNSAPDSINLKYWKISDSNVSSKSVISQTDVIIPPNSYLVVAKDNIFSMYHPYIPVVTAVFSALNNTTPDAVVIYDPGLNIIDSLLYQSAWGGQNGKSLERIDVNESSTTMSNWGTSQDSVNSTPGRINSIARLDYDLAISSLIQSQEIIDGKAVPAIQVVVRNIGRRLVDSILVCFYVDKNYNAVPEAFELMGTSISSRSLIAGDSIQIVESFVQITSGATSIITVVDYWRDERLRNNEAYISVRVCYEPSSLIINEIMYDPLVGQNEWFELFNRSDRTIDLSSWVFHDRSSSSGVNSFVISQKSVVLESGEFMIIAADSSLFQSFPYLREKDTETSVIVVNRTGGFGFNNDCDAIVLKDFSGQTIDSVDYSSHWHHPDVVDTRGRSLERVNPNIESNDQRNWSTCTSIIGGSPGKANSVFTDSRMDATMLSISPNPFSPDGDGYEDFCLIRYNLPLTNSMVSIRIYDIKGRLIRTLANEELTGSQGEIVWDGLSDNKQRVRIGVYVIYLRAIDRVNGKTLSAKGVAVVGARF